MNDYLAKPIRLDDLAEVLARWIPNAHSRQPIDRSALDRLSQCQEPDEPDLIGMTLHLYKTGAPQLFAAIREAADRQDPEMLWRAAHTLKGSSGTIGAREVEAPCTAVERLGRRGTTVARLTCVTSSRQLSSERPRRSRGPLKLHWSAGKTEHEEKLHG